MSGPRTLRIFAKGNVDVRDSLLWSRVNGRLEWNGLNQVLREQKLGATARLQHETAIAFDFIPLPGHDAAPMPPDIAAMLPAPKAHPFEKQHQSDLFAGPTDAVVLSLLPDVMNRQLLHRRSGVRFYAEDERSWAPEPRAWLLRECENVAPMSAEASMVSLERLLDAIDEALHAPVLIYNLCPILPGERATSYLGAADSLALRMKRFNLALAELSTGRDFSIVDVERISAFAGASNVKVDLAHFNAEGWRLIAEEVARILVERGLLDGVSA